MKVDFYAFAKAYKLKVELELESETEIETENEIEKIKIDHSDLSASLKTGDRRNHIIWLRNVTQFDS